MATQQSPARPWHRLASMAFQTSPPPTKQADPVPQPRPIFVRPPLRLTSQPAPPPPQAPIAAAASPVTVPILPERRSPPTAVAPAPGATQPKQAPVAAAAPPVSAVKPPVPRSPPTSVAPAPRATPPKLTVAAPTPPSPATSTTSSSSVLRPPVIRTPPSSSFPVTARPKALPIPSVVPLSSSSSVKQSPIPKDSSQNSLTPKPVSPLPSLTPPLKMRSIIHTPSPLAQSHSELKNPQQIQQKNMLAQETKEIPKMPFMNSNNSEGIPNVYYNKPRDEKREAIKHAHAENKGNYHKKPCDSEEFGNIRDITIAGENKGAVMELASGHFRKKFSDGVFRTWGKGEKTGSDSNSSNEEAKLKTKAKNDETMAKKSTPMTAYVNSNVQEVNNSVLINIS